LAFADRAVPVADLGALRAVPVAAASAEPGATTLWRGRTDLEAALDLATAQLELADPQRRRPWRVILLSDGVETAGSFERILPRLQQDAVRVDTVPLETARAALELAAPRVAERAHAGEPARVTVELWSDLPREVEVVFHADQLEAARHRARVVAGANHLVLPVRLPAAGSVSLRATVLSTAATGELAESPPSLVLVGERRRLLLVANDPAPSTLLASLDEYGWNVDATAPELFSAGALARADAVVLDDVAAERLRPAAHRALRDFALGGGGLLFLAGPSTFGEEGYSETPLEEVLPLRFNVEEERTDVALMIALDKSYSMKGEKMELAKEAAKAVVGELEDEHRFGLVAFDWNPYRVVDLQLVRHREPILEAIRRVEASAQTNFYPALESCFQQLAAVEAKVKHVILISDGRTYPDEYQKLVGAMRTAGITVSTVGVGAEADEALLADIARWGDGAAYLVADANRVQQILLDETRSKTEDTLVEETTSIVVASPSAALEGIDVAAAPALLGRVTLEAHEAADVVLADTEDKPLLARRNVGLGRTWMFAADLGGRYTASWRAWPDAPRLVSQVLRDAVARGGDEPSSLELERAIGGHAVRLSARDADGGPRNGLAPRLEARRSDGTTVVTVPLAQVAPGRYDGMFDPTAVDGDGDLVLRVVAGDLEIPGPTLRAPGSRELEPGPTDVEALRRIADATGGVFDPDDASIAERRETARAPLWPIFAAAALVLYLLELLVRRTGWPRDERAAPAP
jgi:uncharacterized membrane protein